MTKAEEADGFVRGGKSGGRARPSEFLKILKEDVCPCSPGFPPLVQDHYVAKPFSIPARQLVPFMKPLNALNALFLRDKKGFGSLTSSQSLNFWWAVDLRYSTCGYTADAKSIFSIKFQVCLISGS